jgi:hypothetical protein
VAEPSEANPAPATFDAEYAIESALTLSAALGGITSVV